MIEFDKKQDRLAIIAPASGCKDEHGRMDKEKSFERLQATISFFEDYNFQCTYDKQILSGDKLEYFASSKAERIKQLKDAIEDPQVKIIFAFRGGYGCADIVFDCMDIVPSGPKILIGFSDITVLHLLSQHYKFSSIHAVMDTQKKQMLEELISVLDGGDVEIKLQSLTKVKSMIVGEMVGGNLTVLCSMIGTKLSPVTKDKILFIEDVGERGYQIHRHLLHMYRAGLFDEVKAIVFGEFTNSDQDLEPTITSFVEEYLSDIPVYRSNEIGHGDINKPITIGAQGKIIDDCLTIISPFKLI